MTIALTCGIAPVNFSKTSRSARELTFNLSDLYGVYSDPDI